MLRRFSFSLGRIDRNFFLIIFFDFGRRCAARRQTSKKNPSFNLAFFSIFGGGAQHAAKNRKKCQVFIKHFFRFLAAVRSTPPKIEKNAKVPLIYRLEMSWHQNGFVKSFRNECSVFLEGNFFHRLTCC